MEAKRKERGNTVREQDTRRQMLQEAQALGIPAVLMEGRGADTPKRQIVLNSSRSSTSVSAVFEAWSAILRSFLCFERVSSRSPTILRSKAPTLVAAPIAGKIKLPVVMGSGL